MNVGNIYYLVSPSTRTVEAELFPGQKVIIHSDSLKGYVRDRGILVGPEFKKRRYTDETIRKASSPKIIAEAFEERFFTNVPLREKDCWEQVTSNAKIVFHLLDSEREIEAELIPGQKVTFFSDWFNRYRETGIYATVEFEEKYQSTLQNIERKERSKVHPEDGEALFALAFEECLLTRLRRDNYSFVKKEMSKDPITDTNELVRRLLALPETIL